MNQHYPASIIKIKCPRLLLCELPATAGVSSQTTAVRTAVWTQAPSVDSWRTLKWYYFCSRSSWRRELSMWKTESCFLHSRKTMNYSIIFSDSPPNLCADPCPFHHLMRGEEREGEGGGCQCAERHSGEVLCFVPFLLAVAGVFSGSFGSLMKGGKATHQSPLLKAVFFAFIEEICLRAPQIDNLWATISLENRIIEKLSKVFEPTWRGN